MESGDGEREEYVVPRYRAAGDPAWFHALHGAIPGHQLDFMYCPEAPQGAVSRTHIGHLSRLMKYIEPRHGAPFAFSVANLSRDDIQYEPGHGGLGVIFALRVTGVVDHAGRTKPSYSHGAITADRRLDYATLLEAISILYRRFLEKDAQEEDTTGGFYRSYFHMKRDQPEAVEAFLRDYVDHFDELPQPPRSHLGLEWEASEETVPKLVTIVHADDEPFGNIAHAAASLGALLYKSNIKWTTITTGRETEIPGGTWIRFVPASEAPREGRPLSPREARRTASQDIRQLAARDPKGLQVSINDLPNDEAALAHLMFGARAPGGDERAPRPQRPDMRGVPRSDDGAATGSHVSPPVAHHSTRPPPGPSTPPGAPDPSSGDASLEVDFDEAATLQAPFEADPSALGPTPGPAQFPAATAAAAQAPVGGQVAAAAQAPVAAFDPRRSSQTKGVPSAFDPRRSSPTTGVAAVGMQGVRMPGAQAGGPAPISGGPQNAGGLGAGSLVAPAPRVDSPAMPDLDTGPRSALASDPGLQTKSRLGIWIGVVGGLAVIVAVVVAVATGGGEGSASSGGEGETVTSGVPNASGSGTATTPPLPASTPPTASATAGPSTAPAPTVSASSRAPTAGTTSTGPAPGTTSGGGGKSSGSGKGRTPTIKKGGPLVIPNQ